MRASGAAVAAWRMALRNGVTPTPPAIITTLRSRAKSGQKTPYGPSHRMGAPFSTSAMAAEKSPDALMVNRSRSAPGGHEIVNGCGSLQPIGHLTRSVANCPARRAANGPIPSGRESTSDVVSWVSCSVRSTTHVKRRPRRTT